MEEYIDKKYQNMHLSRSTNFFTGISAPYQIFLMKEYFRTRQLSHTTCHMSWPSNIINSYSKIDFCFMPLFFFLFSFFFPPLHLPLILWSSIRIQNQYSLEETYSIKNTRKNSQDQPISQLWLLIFFFFVQGILVLFCYLLA